MSYDEDFNSSDIEVPPQIDEDDGANIGKRAIARIVQGSVQDRVTSKVNVKSLTDVANAPSTGLHRRYWYKLFSQFANATLNLGRRPKLVCSCRLLLFLASHT
jgi:hypothetical protein